MDTLFIKKKKKGEVFVCTLLSFRNLVIVSARSVLWASLNGNQSCRDHVFISVAEILTSHLWQELHNFTEQLIKAAH